MKQTFEELIAKEYYYDAKYDINVVDYRDVLKLLKLCRLKTLEEAAGNADADISFDTEELKDYVNKKYEVYVINSSILNLDKNSIEI